MLILGGISGAGISTLMEDYRTAFMVVTFGFLAVAFYLTYRPRSANGATAPASKIMTFNKVMLWAVTVVVVVFLFYPQMTSNLFATGDEITQEMERTVIRIEGMT